MENILSLFGTSQIQWIVFLIAIDVILGIIATFLKKDFRLGKLGGFMIRSVLGYVLGFAVLEMVAQSLPGLVWFLTVAFVLIVLAIVGSILNNLGKLGVPLPAWLKK